MRKAGAVLSLATHDRSASSHGSDPGPPTCRLCMCAGIKSRFGIGHNAGARDLSFVNAGAGAVAPTPSLMALSASASRSTSASLSSEFRRISAKIVQL